MDITFGVLPLTVLVLQGYRKVTTFVSNYKSYDDDSEQILRTVSVLESILKENLELFLRGIVARKERRDMLANLDSPHWEQDDLNSRLEARLGSHINDVRNAIKNCSLTLDRIHHSQVLSLKKLAETAEPSAFSCILSSVICLRPLSSSTSRKQLVILVKDLVAEVKELCNDLRSHISDLRLLFKVIRQNRGSEHAYEDDSSRPATSAADMAKTRRDTELIHAASRRLYETVSDALVCQCHTVHLCLDGQAAKTPASENAVAGGKTMQVQIQQTPLETMPRFSFSLTHRSGPATKPGSILVCFQPDNRVGDVAASSSSKSGHRTLCAEVASKIEGYERYLQCANQLSGGFRLQLVPSRPHALGGGGSADYISLQEVIKTRYRDLTVHARFLIAVTLARSLLHLYCLPWVRDWGIGTIYYFTAQEGAGASIGQWTPFLVLRHGDSVASDRNDIAADRNRDVYRLGCLLLQVGDLCGDELQEVVGDPDQLEMKRIMERIYSSMGRKYVAFVKSCLTVWGQNRGLNLMGGEHLEHFLAHMEELKTGAMCLSQPAGGMAW